MSVEREPSSYWQDKDWQRQGDIYYGYFGSNGRRWQGAITWGRRGFRDCQIFDPPGELWRHPHASCFYYVGDGSYAVHFNNRPRTIDAAIIAIERILSEATGRRS